MATLNFVSAEKVRRTTKTFKTEERAKAAVEKELDGLLLLSKVNVVIQNEDGRYAPVLMPTSKADVTTLQDTGFEIRVPRHSVH
jgi:DNA-binding cell septation regulator SpoVG